MLIYRNTKAIRSARSSFAGTELGALISQRIDELADYQKADLSDLVKIIVLTSGDSIAEINAELGFSLLHRNCELATRHREWYELTLIIDDSGFGVVFYVPEGPTVGIAIKNYCIAQWSRICRSNSTPC